ncbi:MAG TPA: inositol-3-phosphate synthase [Candidatus Xenobia bacterium]
MLKVWIIGVKGSVASTTIVGIKALQQGLFPTTGLLTETALFNGISLPPLTEMEFGGSDLKAGSFFDAAWATLRDGIYPAQLLKDLQPALEGVTVRPCTAVRCGRTVESIAETPQAAMSYRQIAEQTAKHILEFKGSDDCVVVNLASTEPPVTMGPQHATLEQFEKAIDENSPHISSSMLNAYCALKNGIPFVNFTPSVGADIPALEELALKTRTPHCGKDGKTGETLVKTALAPMFLYRNLRILGWYGTNILGNLDGKVLENPDNKATKIQTKDAVLTKAVGYSPVSKVAIDYFPPVGEDKIAWDFIVFEGFGGHRMRMQFTWEGCDSILAAPLVIDLIRLVQFTKHLGLPGLQKQLGLFFKSPMGSDVVNLFEQYEHLRQWVDKVKTGAVAKETARV